MSTVPHRARIREAYPSLALEARNQRDMESFDQLLAGELDLAVRSREALPHGLRFEPLFASDRVLIVPRGHELAGKKRPTLRDVAHHAFVIPPAGGSEPAINAASVGNPDDQHDEALIDDRVDDSMVADPNPHQVMAFQLLRT